MSLFHKSKPKKQNNDELMRLMAPTIAGMVVCMICLASMTWAWFTASVDTTPQTIESATRSTEVTVYELGETIDENGNATPTKTLVKPKAAEAVTLSEAPHQTEDEIATISDESVKWELSPEKTYEVIMTGGGTASTGYCRVALSHTLSGGEAPETKRYTTASFDQEQSMRFIYNTGGFSDAEGVTATSYLQYIENTSAPTLEISSCWGRPPELKEEEVALMSLQDNEDEILLLSDGDILGLAPIPRPEAKAKTEVELDGFEIENNAVISAENDYRLPLTLKEGYALPEQVTVSINGKNYVVSTMDGEASDKAPYYDAKSGALIIPSALLSDGATVSVKGSATLIPEEIEEEEEVAEEETEAEEESEETPSEETKEEEETETEETNKKDKHYNNDSPEAPSEEEGNDGENSENTENGEASEEGGTDENAPSEDGEAEAEKADVKLNLSQLTINLEETQIPTNADLILTLSAIEDAPLPEKIVVTLDKTVRDEETAEGEETVEDEEIIEDKTDYVINLNGEDNPEGFEFNPETCELKISSALLAGVREITIADFVQSEAPEEDGEVPTISFEVKNLSFDFTSSSEPVTEEDVVITFTAGEEYELPETIVVTIDGEEYVIYTSEEESDKNSEEITFDAETGALTISKNLLEDATEITIIAEGVKKEDEESEEETPETEEPTEPEETPETEEPTEPEETPDSGENEDSTENGDNPESDGDDVGENIPDGPQAPENGENEDSTEETPSEPTEPEEIPDSGENEDSTENGDNPESEDGDVGTDVPDGPSNPVDENDSGSTEEAPSTPAEPAAPAPSTPSESGTSDEGSQSGDSTPAAPAPSIPSAPAPDSKSDSGEAAGSSDSSSSEE